MGQIVTTAALAALCLLANPARAAWVTNVPSADTSLIELAPTNNNGAQAWVLAGRIQNDFYRNRGLFKFNFSNLPSNSVILSAAAVLQVTRVPAEAPANATFGLRRMLRPWGEGNKFADIGQPPGHGQPATAGEATWLCAFHPTNLWSTPGGAEGQDFSAIESSFQFISDLGTYRFDSTPELVADVQDWVANPASNYGWMLICNAEDTIWNARRFGSREDPDACPTLEIEYLVPPRIDSFARFGNQSHLTFTPAIGHSYAVELRNTLTAGSWLTLTNLGPVTNTIPLTVIDSTAVSSRFYRVTAN